MEIIVQSVATGSATMEEVTTKEGDITMKSDPVFVLRFAGNTKTETKFAAIGTERLNELAPVGGFTVKQVGMSSTCQQQPHLRMERHSSTVKTAGLPNRNRR